VNVLVTLTDCALLYECIVFVCALQRQSG